MAAVKLLLVLSVVNLVHVQASPQLGSGKGGPPVSVPDTCNFFDIVDHSMLRPNVMNLKDEILSSLGMVEMFAVNLRGQTDRLPALVTKIKDVGVQALTVMKHFMETIERMAADRTIPVLKLLELFEKPYKKLKKFTPEIFEPFINEIREHMGCTVAYEVKTIAKGIHHQANQIASIIDRLEKVVKDSCRRRRDIVQLVRVLSNRVVKLTALVVEAKTLFASAADGIRKAASLLIAVDTARNVTMDTMKTNRDLLRRNVTAIRESALLAYIAGIESIRTNVSAAIRNLTVFDTNRKLSKLTKQFDSSYVRLFQYLRDQNRTDLANVRQYYRTIVKNIETAVKKVSDKFLDAAFRTALRLVDIVLERSSDSDACFTEYAHHVAEPFSALPERILQCTILEPPRWVAVVEAFDANVGLLNISYDQLAMNIAGCANYTNFTVDNLHYLQARACLRTNLEDLNNLANVLEPQFELIDRAIKLDVNVSKFRVENCLANLLHNSTVVMKVTRTRIERCAGRIDDCPRKNRDNDKSDWFARYNLKDGLVDESDEVTSAEKVIKKFSKIIPINEDEEVSYEINSEEDAVNDEQKAPEES